METITIANNSDDGDTLVSRTESPIVILKDVCYQMDMGCNHDVWRLGGKAFGHPNFKDGTYVYPSAPVSFDIESEILTTSSGRQYKIDTYSTDKSKVINQIEEDIVNGGYELYQGSPNN